ncbi:MAG: hypothetical protein OEY59_10460 [Deltaproteobacteria bacterium]|nr:hypothetical protein [Deltaproteobacteria bacterium]
MGFTDLFKGDANEKLNYLEQERKKLWAKVVELEDLLNKKTEDYEKEARQASKKTSEYRNKSQNAYDETISILEAAKKIKEQIGANLQLSVEDNVKIKENLDEVNTSIIKIQNFVDTTTSMEKAVNEKVKLLEAVFEAHPNLDEEIERLEDFHSESEEVHGKIASVHKASLSKKQEIDELYWDIHGYEDKSEDGEIVEVEGKKDKLENSYKKIQGNLNQLEVELYEFKGNKKKELDEFLLSWSEKITNINDKISQLLPQALTAGLSFAYSEKKTNEEKESKKHFFTFKVGILGLVFVSLIPFGVNLFLLDQGRELYQLMIDTPRLVLGILPLYIPFLWIAYSSSKKNNLSKRLIEEYTHKEVLSKTFQGLSEQIKEIDDEAISSELRIKLLYNLLSVSSENPGKLITDYNKTDHPLMDALEKSVQLGTAVEKFAEIPGVAKLLKIAEKKADKKLKEQGKKAEEGLETLSDKVSSAI